MNRESRLQNSGRSLFPPPPIHLFSSGVRYPFRPPCSTADTDRPAVRLSTAATTPKRFGLAHPASAGEKRNDKGGSKWAKKSWLVTEILSPLPRKRRLVVLLRPSKRRPQTLGKGLGLVNGRPTARHESHAKRAGCQACYLRGQNRRGGSG